MKITGIVDAEGIIVTMPKAFFREFAVESFEKELESLNDTEETNLWYRIMKNLPIFQPKYCYFIYDGKVQCRTNILEYQRNVTKTFKRPEGGVRTFTNANMIALCAPYIKAPEEIVMKGFQGFRYTHKLF